VPPLFHRDPVYRKRAREAIYELEEFFTARDWAALAVGRNPLTVTEWMTKGKVPSPAYLEQVERLVAFARDLEPIIGDKAQSGWWLVCRHFLLPPYPAHYLNQPASHEKLLDVARDDVQGARLHRASAPQPLPHFGANQRYAQVTQCPWYALTLPSHPTLYEKRRGLSQPVLPEPDALSDLLVDVL
jgi:hypothetical protein